MTLSSFQLSEPVVEAMVSLLSSNLNTTIASLNATVTDGFLVTPVVQFLPYVPIPSSLEGGMPVVGVQRLGIVFEDDLQSTTNAQHTYAVVAIVQNADHQTLVWQLDRTMQAVAFTLQADRLAGTSSGTGGIMRTQAGVWSVNFIRMEPGPLLGDLDPLNPEAPPRSYLSWTAMILESWRSEQPGF